MYLAKKLNVYSYSCYGKLLLMLFGLLCCMHECMALSSDKTAPLNFQADSVDMNHTTHHGVYIGHVAIDQGSTHIRAETIITDGDNEHEVTKAILKGKDSQQAYYTTITDKDKQTLQAYADIIYYYPERHFVELIGHAKVLQGANSIVAHHISYDVTTAHVITQYQAGTPATIIIQKAQATL